MSVIAHMSPERKMRESIASNLDCDETVKRQLEEYFHDLDDIYEAEDRLI